MEWQSGTIDLHPQNVGIAIIHCSQLIHFIACFHRRNASTLKIYQPHCSGLREQHLGQVQGRTHQGQNC